MDRYVVTAYSYYGKANLPQSWSVWDREEQRWVSDAPVGMWAKAAACAALMNGEELEIVREDLRVRGHLGEPGPKERFYLIKAPISYGGFCIEFETREAVESFIAKYSTGSKVLT